MTGAKRDARDDDPGGAAAEPHFEAVQRECPLQFFADAAGDDHHQRKQRRIARRFQQSLQRVLRHGAASRATNTTVMAIASATKIIGTPAAASAATRRWPTTTSRGCSPWTIRNI